ncbi:MAG: extracellular solute-binding protein [Chloroflexi bacterium]|nr:extracellular solute-binding protein [Chloroflexota bacterium]
MNSKKEVSVKGMSRRTFLKGTAGSIAAALAASGPGQLLAKGIYAPTVIRQNKTVVLAIQEFAHDAIKAVLPDFEKDTGLTVTLEGGPVSGNDMLTKYAPAFASGESPVDVVSDADDSGPTFMRAGYMLSLEDVIPQETWDDFPESMGGQIEKFHSFDGQRYRVPHEFAIGYFFTRKDWLDEKNLKAPTTWEEMVEIGKEFADPANSVWGTTDGLIKPALLYVYVAYLTAQSGGDVFAFDEATGEALQFLYDMIYTHKIFPEDALNQDYTAQNQLYMGDKVAFMRQWPFFQGVAEGDKEWFKPEKLTIELPPAGPAGSKAWWGGWGFSIPAFAPNMDGAKELIKYLTSNEIAPKLAEGQSWFIMPRTSILSAFEGQDNPIVTAMGVYAEAGVPAARPFHPRVAEAQTIVDDAASQFLTKQLSLADALKYGQEQIAALGE